ncbi:AraC family transcriptional regulator [Martelella alba]|uniref:AraC family transcriptional regulator n=1 Tax=Martelella alba TaxID=2590451 RepID=A0ABY2SL37_9HYPH|nr:AraC family transcriptional regulator [Martelella alba]TKI04108.1 AraC family transcriptional regulator [Martelella alba]
MIDPLAEMVALLQPSTPFSKLVSSVAPWRISRTETGRPFYCVIFEGSCRLDADGQEPIILREGDFVLIPSSNGFSMSSVEPAAPAEMMTTAVPLADGEFRLGAQCDTPDARWLVGYCVFGSPDTALLLSLLPQVMLVRGEKRLSTLLRLVREESRAQRPAREVILARLLEVLLIEALRSTAGTGALPGLVRGLADERLAAAIRRMHEDPGHAWTATELAKAAAMSRSAFFARFNQAVGMAPMTYLLAWRMAIAKDLLRRGENNIADIAERAGYGSASTFSVAFTRHVGIAPTRYARVQQRARG